LHKKFENELDESTTSVCINQAKNLISKMNYKLKEFTNEKNYNRIDDLMVVLKEMTNFVNEGEEFYGIDLNNYEDILYNLEKIRKLFTQKKIISEHFDLFLTTFTRMMKLVDSTEMSNEDYYLHVGPKSSKKSYALKVNCLNAAFTFQRLVQQKPRSMIFCSGTLGPFEVW
jgi:Rad3-related DNA helicase